jgi:hypothetical protein
MLITTVLCATIADGRQATCLPSASCAKDVFGRPRRYQKFEGKFWNLQNTCCILSLNPQTVQTVAGPCCKSVIRFPLRLALDPTIS